MTSNKPNKKVESRKSKVEKQGGQALLLTMMLVATVLTVFLSMSFKSTTETQVTKLEEESQKTLAVAEAGIEAALKTGSVDIKTGLSSDITAGGFTGTAVCRETYDKNYFISPLIQKDEQYTFYLAAYDSSTFAFSDYYSGNVTLYYGSQTSCDDISLEITLLYADNAGTNHSLTRWISDSYGMLGSDTNDIYLGNSGYDLGGVHFNCSTSAINMNLTDYPKPKLLMVRSFGSQTQIGLSGTAILKSQGKICESSATSSTITKKLYLLQSYPQISADSFVTSF